MGTISGIVASILAILLAAAAIIFYRRHRANGKAATGVAFENPTYTRGLEQVQVSCCCFYLFVTVFSFNLTHTYLTTHTCSTLFGNKKN